MWHRWLVLGAAAVLAGCGGADSKLSRDTAAPGHAGAQVQGGGTAEAEAAANLAKLAPEDRKLAEAQRFCAVRTNNRLGSMGVPVKVTVQGQPVFLCCQGCEKQALANPDKTLARAREMASGKPAPGGAAGH